MADVMRKHLLDNVRKQVYCTVGSVGRPVSESSLIGLFREDNHGEDMIQLARGLGYISIEAMLRSTEFQDIIETDFSADALGARKHEPVVCYKAKTKPRTSHILPMLSETAQLREQRNERFRKASTIPRGHPAFNETIIEGRMTFLRFLDSLTALRIKGNGAVRYCAMQEAYETQYGLTLNSTELKRLFNKSSISKICASILYDDIEMFKDTRHEGDLYLKMKRPMEEIEDEYKRVKEQQAREESERKMRAEEERKRREDEMIRQNATRKKTNNTRWGKKNLMRNEVTQVHIRPLTPDYAPNLVPVVLKQDKLHTPFPHIGRIFGAKGLGSKCSLGDEKPRPPSSDEDISENSSEEHIAQAPETNIGHTSNNSQLFPFNVKSKSLVPDESRKEKSAQELSIAGQNSSSIASNTNWDTKLLENSSTTDISELDASEIVEENENGKISLNHKSSEDSWWPSRKWTLETTRQSRSVVARGLSNENTRNSTNRANQNMMRSKSAASRRVNTVPRARISPTYILDTAPNISRNVHPQPLIPSISENDRREKISEQTMLITEIVDDALVIDMAHLTKALENEHLRRYGRVLYPEWFRVKSWLSFIETYCKEHISVKSCGRNDTFFFSKTKRSKVTASAQKF
ncbi:hypothetical protein DdX_03616 [Ditylenchus destructor]|uniref:Uncharacterized protein n=1 Tax=Ditylenchus destructor TaxID=166010 RepID=A0AAD4NC06_9BILA|nr:hypothetical protein DdX_03616 [Ditylenchus destructor]